MKYGKSQDARRALCANNNNTSEKKKRCSRRIIRRAPTAGDFSRTHDSRQSLE